MSLLAWLLGAGFGYVVGWAVLGGVLLGGFFLAGLVWDLSNAAYSVHWVLGAPLRVLAAIVWLGWGLSGVAYIFLTISLPIRALLSLRN